MKRIVTSFIFVALTFLSACNLPNNQTPVAATATRIVLSTPVVIPPTITLAAQPAATHTPTIPPAEPTVNVVTSTASSGDTTKGGNPLPVTQTAPVRVKFVAGGTVAEVKGTVPANTSLSYLVEAMANQTMILTLADTSSNVALAVTGVKDGQKLLTADTNAKTWKGTLPASQDYKVEVVATGSSSAAFDLIITIPANIKYGTYSYKGPIQGKGVVSFLLNGTKGESVTAALTSTTSDVFLSIYGLDDGTSLVSSSSKAATWTGTLPSTQKYLLQAVSTGMTTTFTLKVTTK